MAKLPLAFLIISLITFAYLIGLSAFLTFKFHSRSGKVPQNDEGEPLPIAYEDEDGMATAESQKNHQVVFAKWIALPSSLIGLALSVVFTVARAQGRSGQDIESVAGWLYLADWVRSYSRTSPLQWC